MSWFKIDDGFADHPKVIALQSRRGWASAVALWTLSGAWASKHLTDGHVPSGIIRRLGCAPADARALVAVGLWVEVEGGYRFHDFHDYNPAESEVKAKREATRERVARYREERRRNASGNASGNAPCNALQPRAGNDPVTPPPTRPDPTRPVVNNPLPPSPPEAEPDAPPPEPPSRGKPRLPVSEVFGYWRERAGKSAATKLDAKRRRRIEWALGAYGLEAVQRCIDGYAASEWHMGANDRGQRYDDLTLWLRDAEHVERGIAMAAEGPNPMRRGALPPATIDPEASRRSIAAARELFGDLPSEAGHG